MEFDLARINGITERIIGCAMAVHRAWGPGLLESVYRRCLVVELRAANIMVRTHQRIPLTYRDQRVGRLEFDVLVEESVVVEVKAVERVHPVHSAQVITYLKLLGCPIGLLMNFNATTLKAGLKRLEHPELYGKKLGGSRVRLTPHGALKRPGES